MKKTTTMVLIVFVFSLFVWAQELNTAIEFYLVKNETAKSAILTAVFTVKMMDGKSLTAINQEVKAKLAENLKLSNIIKEGQDAQWIFTSQAVTAGGEFFADEKEATTRLEKMKTELRKKGYTITDYPFKFESEQEKEKNKVNN